MFLELVSETRTIRRFDRSKFVTDTDVTHILECARRSASAGNLQRLRYITVTGSATEAVFSEISLGGYLPKEKKPTSDVAPTAYIVITAEAETPDANLLIDVGIAAQTIALSAAEKGIGTCMIRNFKREYFSSLCPHPYNHPILVIALGYADEISKTVDIEKDEDIKYYKNENDVNIVPKRTLSELVVRKIQ